MSAPVLHYIFDPLCGWCYGAAPLLEAARSIEGLAIELHGGGMMVGAHRQKVTPELRSYINGHDQRIARLSGQPFGDAYRNGLLNDPTAVLDSEPPTLAILAADALGHRGLDLLQHLQYAHFIEGRRIADRPVLKDVAVSIGIDGEAFSVHCTTLEGQPVREHIAASRTLLARVGGQGFPTFALAQGNRVRMLDFGPWLGKPEEWKANLAAALRAD